MNSSNKASLISTLIILATGVILCFGYGMQNSSRIIIFIVGASFLIASLVNMVILGDSRDRQGRRRRSLFSSVIGWIVSVAGIGLGIAMLVTPGTFVTGMVYLFGGILVLTAIWQAVTYMRGLPGYRYPGWVYIMPLLTAADGATMLFYTTLRDEAHLKYVVLMMGIGLIIIAVANGVVYIEISRYNRRLRRGEAALAANPEAYAPKAAASSHAPQHKEADDDNTVEPSI